MKKFYPVLNVLGIFSTVLSFVFSINYHAVMSYLESNQSMLILIFTIVFWAVYLGYRLLMWLKRRFKNIEAQKVDNKTIDGLNENIKSVDATMDERIKSIDATMNKRIETMNALTIKRMNTMNEQLMHKIETLRQELTNQTQN